ncbi:helix-turn-helix domain-containing protein [Micromonospora tulbaghiae]|uniref:helix-turn-helix domain-containing protein n=1 Tax=Micromonospora tulbaghiae TaxID=479978 RepID=UPI0033F25F77
MGVKLLAEVLDHAPADWTPAERLFIAVLAEKARDHTRRSWPGQATITRRTGLKPDSVTRLCHRLAAKGWELREQQGVDRAGKPIFAYRGHAAVYVIPQMCPLGDHMQDVCFPPKARTAVRPISSAAPTGSLTDNANSPDGGPAISGGEASDAPAGSGESPDGGPAFAGTATEESPDDGPAIPPPATSASPDGGPGFSEKARTVVRESPDGGPALTVNEPSNFNPHTPAPTPPRTIPSPRPTDEVLNWSIANDQSQRRTGSINPPKTGRQSALFAAKDVKLTEREQIVRDWLQANDYPSDPAFVKDVAVKVQRAFTGKSLGYLRGVAAPTGSGFGPFAEAVRQERAEATEKAIRALEDSEPACEHGTLAGRALHPTHQHLICPQCRIGAPARPAASETRPAVAAALAAYRSAWRGLPLTVTQVIEFTQQAEALHSGGVPAQQLADLAHLAASHGIRLIAAATRKDHAS